MEQICSKNAPSFFFSNNFKSWRWKLSFSRDPVILDLKLQLAPLWKLHKLSSWINLNFLKNHLIFMVSSHKYYIGITFGLFPYNNLSSASWSFKSRITGSRLKLNLQGHNLKLIGKKTWSIFGANLLHPNSDL